MAIVPQPSLFSWGDLEARSDLDRLDLVLNHFPDQQILKYLTVMRGKGRNDFPILAMWNALLAGIVFQHRSINDLCRELSRNPALLERCGFNPLPLQQAGARYLQDTDSGEVTIIHLPAKPAKTAAPRDYNFTRFLANIIELEECLGMISALVPQLREQLMDVLPDFGKHLGFDGTDIESHSTGYKRRESGCTSDSDADWGRHETLGIDANGKSWTKIKRWFGYGLHLIADTHYELPVAFEVTPASHHESPVLRRMIKSLFHQSPSLAEACHDFTADRGLDCAETKALLWDSYGIRPLIDTRLLWREEKQQPDFDPKQAITRSLYPHRVDSIVYTETGQLHCICPTTGTKRDLVFHGFESKRKTLKYRCPAAYYDLECKGQARCHQMGQVNANNYGRVVRIQLDEHDRRIFTPTPHGSPSWKRAYKRRNALERINNRIDNHFGFEDHHIRGRHKMTTCIGLALAVMLSMALGHAKAGRYQKVRSLVSPAYSSG